jgi:uncharacterized protein YigA (DUF484 family)
MCGHHASTKARRGSGRPRRTSKSFALVPLRHEDLHFGVVALASEDPKRFYPEMGTLYLARIGDLMGHALWRFVTPVREHALPD